MAQSTRRIFARPARAGIVVPGAAGRVSVGLSFYRRSNYIFAAGERRVRALCTMRIPARSCKVCVQTLEASSTTSSSRATRRTSPVASGRVLSCSARPAVNRAGPADFDTIVLSGVDWQQLGGTNANGIEATPNGKDTDHRQHGRQARVSRRSAERGSNADRPRWRVGFLWRRIAAPRPAITSFATVEPDRGHRLASDLASGTLVDTLTHPASTCPRQCPFGNAIYAVNARFGLRRRRALRTASFG